MPRNTGPVVYMERLPVAARLAEPDFCQAHWYCFVADRLFAAKRPFRVLDVGAGTGYGIDILRRTSSAFQVDGIDPLPLRDDIAATPIGEIESKSYDIVIAADVIEHVEEDEQFFDDLLRVAGEAVFISTPNWLVSKCKNPHHVREYTPAELAALLDGLTFSAHSSGDDLRILEHLDLLDVQQSNLGIWIAPVGVRLGLEATWKRRADLALGSLPFASEEWLRAAIAFVRQRVAHGEVPSPNTADPITILRLGCGQCSHRSLVFVWLMKAMGLYAEPRSLATPKGHGHMIAVVNLAPFNANAADAAGRWATADVDHGHLFTSPNGEMAHPDSLAAFPDWVAAERDPWTEGDETLPDFFAPGPRAANFMIGDRCNAKCIMCWQARRRATAATERWAEMSGDVVERIVGLYGKGLSSIELVSFGEPLINPDFDRMVAAGAAAAARPALNVITNGSLLHRHPDLLRLPGDLTVSVDAVEEAYERIRPGLSWSRVAANISEAANFSGRHTRRAIGINCTVFEDSLACLLDVAAFADQQRLSYLSILRGAALETTDAAGREIAADDPRLAAAVALIRERFPSLRVNDYATSRDLPPVATGPIRPGRSFCPLPWRQLDVGPDGIVHPCCRSYHTNLGVADEDVWRGAPLRELRRQILADAVDPGRFADCARCPNLGAGVLR